MELDLSPVLYAALVLLFVSAGLIVSLVLALAMPTPWYLDLMPALLFGAIGHGVAVRLSGA